MPIHTAPQPRGPLLVLLGALFACGDPVTGSPTAGAAGAAGTTACEDEAEVGACGFLAFGCETVDLRTHGRHCGACGADCGGADCADGLCKAGPVVLHGDAYAFYCDLIVTGADLIFSDCIHGSVLLRTPDGRVKELAERGFVYEMIADGPGVFWTSGPDTDGRPAAVMWASKTDGRVKELHVDDRAHAHVGALGVDDTRVYWSWSVFDPQTLGITARGVRAGARWGGGPVVDLVADVGTFTLGERALYFLRGAAIAFVPKEGGPIEQLARVPATAEALEHVDGWLYFVADERLHRVSAESRELEDLGLAASPFAVHGNSVAFATHDRLLARAFDEQTPSTVAWLLPYDPGFLAAAPDVSGLTITADSVFWVVEHETIWRAPR